MLILARKAGETIRIGEDVKVTVIRVRKNEVRLGLDAPREIRISTPERECGGLDADSASAPDDS